MRYLVISILWVVSVIVGIFAASIVQLYWHLWVVLTQMIAIYWWQCNFLTIILLQREVPLYCWGLLCLHWYITTQQVLIWWLTTTLIHPSCFQRYVIFDQTVRGMEGILVFLLVRAVNTWVLIFLIRSLHTGKNLRFIYVCITFGSDITLGLLHLMIDVVSVEL
jgi:hypothetical protein